MFLGGGGGEDVRGVYGINGAGEMECRLQQGDVRIRRRNRTVQALHRSKHQPGREIISNDPQHADSPRPLTTQRAHTIVLSLPRLGAAASQAPRQVHIITVHKTSHIFTSLH